MTFQKNNQFWKNVKNPGAPIKFKTPEILWQKACEYFQWCDNNPLKEEKLFHYQGIISRDTVSKMRAYTLKELCLFLGVGEAYFKQFNEEKHNEFSSIITRIRDTIYTQKFTGAAAELLNSNIIASDLGLKAKIEQDLNIKGYLNYTTEERDKRIKDLLDKKDAE